MACITIAYRTFLLPTNKAMQVMELMQNAFEVEADYRTSNDGYVYTVGAQPNLELTIIKPHQIVPTPQTEAKPIALLGGSKRDA